jgi:excisionase family DNA binding protein
VHCVEKRVVSLKEAAHILGCSIDTVRRAVKSGQLKAFQINKQGNYRITVDEIERFMQGKGYER